MHSCMTDAIGQIENHDVIIASLGYRSEARPVVRHVVHHRFPGRCTHHQHFVAKRATRIVWSGYELDHCFPLFGLVCVCVPSPMEEWRCQMRVCHDRVSLSRCKNNHILELELYIKLKFSLNHSYAQTTNKIIEYLSSDPSSKSFWEIIYLCRFPTDFTSTPRYNLLNVVWSFCNVKIAWPNQRNSVVADAALNC